MHCPFTVLRGSGIKETRAVSGQADHGSPDLPPVLPRNWAKGLAKSGTGYNNMGGVHGDPTFKMSIYEWAISGVLIESDLR
jgi:hypothetical protein